ncbi:MAG: hypothetical protein M1819_003711 [Sarea resinae]|nr:MAG: hypothetical protein M1819_003711 [Sarea resinae]
MSPPVSKEKIRKLPRLPQHARVQKRPLLHPAIPSPYTSARFPKVVYISTSTPFISAVKRVRGLLAQIDKRAMGKDISLLHEGKSNNRNGNKSSATKLAEIPSGSGTSGFLGGKDKDGVEGEEVMIKATGKAIEKALKLGLFFQGEEDCAVRIRTGGVGTVDDVMEGKKRKNGGRDKEVRKDRAQDKGGDGKGGSEEEEEELPETRVRKTSMLEIGVRLR